MGYRHKGSTPVMWHVAYGAAPKDSTAGEWVVLQDCHMQEGVQRSLVREGFSGAWRSATARCCSASLRAGAAGLSSAGNACWGGHGAPFLCICLELWGEMRGGGQVGFSGLCDDNYSAGRKSGRDGTWQCFLASQAERDAELEQCPHPAWQVGRCRLLGASLQYPLPC